MVYVDLTKPHMFMYNYISNGTTSGNSGILYIYPIISNILPFRIVGTNSNQTYSNEGVFFSYVSGLNSSQSVVFSGISSIALVSGVLKIVSPNMNLYEM